MTVALPRVSWEWADGSRAEYYNGTLKMQLSTGQNYGKSVLDRAALLKALQTFQRMLPLVPDTVADQVAQLRDAAAKAAAYADVLENPASTVDEKEAALAEARQGALRNLGTLQFSVPLEIPLGLTFPTPDILELELAFVVEGCVPEYPRKHSRSGL